MSIHPTAIVDSSARIADDAEIGAYAIVEADTEIGSGSKIRPHAVIRRYTIMGKNNIVDSSTVLGGEPQDLKFDPDMVSYLRIGDGNIFRECVTINRATKEGSSTTVGNNTYWMNHAHAGHDVTIGSNVIMPSNTQVAGHSRIDDGAILPANGNIHQFCWVGKKVMFQGGAQVSMHVPPFVLCAMDNNVVGLNVVGLKRDPNISDEDRKQIKEAFEITYRSGLPLEKAVEQLDACSEWEPAACEFRQFVKDVFIAQPPYKRGLCPRLGRLAGRRG